MEDLTLLDFTNLNQALHLVDFKEFSRGSLTLAGDCVLGLDVGSTTTKAVLINKSDSKILASIYLRTNGDPVNAARNCYKAILEQINRATIKICGLGVTGSGRQIAALHALTENVINEIVAHATAAAFLIKRLILFSKLVGRMPNIPF